MACAWSTHAITGVGYQRPEPPAGTAAGVGQEMKPKIL